MMCIDAVAEKYCQKWNRHWELD